VAPLEQVPVVTPESHDSPLKAHLEEAKLQPESTYGHTDPASLAAVQSHELPDASMQALAAQDIDNPRLVQWTEGARLSQADARPGVPPGRQSEGATTFFKSKDFSNWDPHLAHLAQVGLTPADHWDEQFKPRIDQLHEDITQVNEQLDDLEKAKPKTKKS
jgi:hypothetical protein